MSWTNFPCIPKWTFTDDEATDFDQKMLPGGEIVLSIDTFSVLYGSVIEALSATTVTLRLYDDEDRTNEVIVGDYTGQPYTIAYYNGWVWKPTLYNGTLDPEGRGTFVSREVELYISGGKLEGEYVATVLPNGEFDVRFRGTFTPFPLAVIGLEATIDTGSGALPAGTYNFFVTAVDSSAREGGASWIEVVLPSMGNVTLSWYPVEGAVSYNIYRDCELLESGVLIETIVDSGQVVEDENTAPPRDPEPTIPAPSDPILTVTIDPETGELKFDVVLEENEISQTIHPNIVLIDDGSSSVVDVFTDVDGATVIVKYNGDQPVSYHSTDGVMICEGNIILDPPINYEDVFDILYQVAPPDFESNIGPAVSWGDILTGVVSGAWKIRPKETIGIVYPQFSVIRSDTTDPTLVEFIVHYNDTISTTAESQSDTGGNLETEFVVPHFYGFRAVEKTLPVGGFVDITTLYSSVGSGGNSWGVPIVVDLGGSFTPFVEISPGSVSFPINFRITVLPATPSSPFSQMDNIIFRNGLTGVSSPVNVDNDTDLVATGTITGPFDNFVFVYPFSAVPFSLLIELEQPASEIPDVEFSGQLLGNVFQLECRDADPGEKLQVSSGTVNYLDTYTVGGQSYGTRVATKISGDLSNDVQPILDNLNALYQVFSNPFSSGYMNILGARNPSGASPSAQGNIPQLTFPFVFPPEVVVDIQQERENTLTTPDTQRQFLPGFE